MLDRHTPPPHRTLNRTLNTEGVDARVTAGDGPIQSPAPIKPGLIGRLLRLIVGGLQVTAVVIALTNSNLFLHPEQPFTVSALVPIWLAVSLLVGLRWLGDMINIAFRVTWGTHAYPILLVAAMVAASLGITVYDAIWAPPLSLLALLTILYTMGHLGASHIIAAALATPGCEMRSLPHLIAILRRTQHTAHFCPGIWTALDQQEQHRNAKRPTRSGHP